MFAYVRSLVSDEFLSLFKPFLLLASRYTLLERNCNVDMVFRLCLLLASIGIGRPVANGHGLNLAPD